MAKRSPSPGRPSALAGGDANAADADTRRRHESIWQEFLRRPAVFVLNPRIFSTPGVVAMLSVQAPVADPAVGQRLRDLMAGLQHIPCIEPFPDRQWHLTIVPPALLTTENPRPPLLLPDGFQRDALQPMREAARGYGPFDVRLQGLNVFQHVLVAEAYDGGHMAELRRRLIVAVPQFPEKYWNVLPPLPHVSLARFTCTEGVAPLRDALTQRRDVCLGTLRVTQVDLVRTPLREGVFGEAEKQAIPLTE